jgi:hypothetical protein
MVTVSTLCGIVSIIGTPIIVFIRLLVLISAEFQSVRDMYKRLNGGRKISVVPVISRLASGLRSGLASWPLMRQPIWICWFDGVNGASWRSRGRSINLMTYLFDFRNYAASSKASFVTILYGWFSMFHFICFYIAASRTEVN